MTDRSETITSVAPLTLTTQRQCSDRMRAASRASSEEWVLSTPLVPLSAYRTALISEALPRMTAGERLRQKPVRGLRAQPRGPRADGIEDHGDALLRSPSGLP